MRRILVSLALLVAGLLLWGSSVRAALPATETCASSGTLANPPWAQLNTGLNVVGSGSGSCTDGNTNNDVGVRWTTATDTFGADQFSQMTVSMTAGKGTGVNYEYLWVRTSSAFALGAGSAGNSYWFWSDGGSDTEILYTLAGVPTTIDTANSLTYTVGDTLKLEVVGSTIKVYKNGAAITWTTSGVDHVTDSHVTAAGQPAVGGFTNTGSAGEKLFSAWTANNVGGGVTCAPTLSLMGVGRCG